MRASRLCAAVLVSVVVAGCGDDSGGGGGDGDGGSGTAVDACVGLECAVVSCTGGVSTTLTGKVFAPNGNLPLYNVTVYVPRDPVAPLPAGATCDRCGQAPSGNPIAITTTDTRGEFRLENVPATSDVPLVIQVGKWRRQIVVPAVPSCVETPLTSEQTRLPKNRSEGDIPQMALTTGGADALECLLRKIGLDDSEFTSAGGPGRVHLYAGTGGTPRFAPTLNGGAAFADAQTLWDTTAHLTPYDVSFLSCEAGPNRDTKPVPARQAMSDYTDVGGRVFMSHWHNVWIEEAPVATLWPTVLTPNHLSDLGNVTVDVNTGFAKGADLADWLVNVMASTMRGRIALTDTQHTVEAVDERLAEKWIYKDQTANNRSSVQYFQFTTPLTVDPVSRCGKVVFSDIHVSTGDDSNTNLRFPAGCTTSGLTNQEKVLAFMIFDIASCVGPPIGRAPPPGAVAPPMTATVSPR